MNTRISEHPNSYLEVKMDQGEELIVERGGMIYAEGDYVLNTKIEARTVNSWIAKLLGGKSLSYNIYQAKSKLNILFSPEKNAELFEINILPENNVLIEPDAHFARTKKISLQLAKQSWKNTFNDGLKLKVYGEGHLFLTVYGKVIQKEIDCTEPILVDEDALVAYDEKLHLKTVSKGVKRLLTSGEGYLFEIKGKGRIWLQTRKEESKSGGSFISSILDIFR